MVEIYWMLLVVMIWGMEWDFRNRISHGVLSRWEKKLLDIRRLEHIGLALYVAGKCTAEILL